MQSNLHNYFSPKKPNQPSPAGAASPSGIKRTASFQEDDSEESTKRVRLEDGAPGSQTKTSSYFKSSAKNSTPVKSSSSPSISLTARSQPPNNKPTEVLSQQVLSGITEDMLDIDDFVLPTTPTKPPSYKPPPSTPPSYVPPPSTPPSYVPPPRINSSSLPTQPATPPRTFSAPASQATTPSSQKLSAQNNSAPPIQRGPPSSQTTTTLSQTTPSSQKPTPSPSQKTPSSQKEKKEPKEPTLREKLEKIEDEGTKKVKSTHKLGGKEGVRFTFLEDIRDDKGHPPDHPEYDKSTLYIPNSEYIKLTPFERQYWDVKRKFFDTIIFFKKGKFYELYEQDADIAHKLLDLKVSERVNMRMAGVPEQYFSQWASKFLQQGFKVGKVDELETGIGMAKRQHKEGVPKSKDVVIRRELSCVLTAGTLTDPSLIPDASTHFLLALKEEDSKFGFVLIDASAGAIHLGQFEDDARFSTLETLLLQTSPKEILHLKGALSPAVVALIKRTLNKPTFTACESNAFCEPHETLRQLAEGGYYEDKNFPDALKSVLRDLGGEQEADGCSLVLSALGACISYMQVLRLDRTLFSTGTFCTYNVHSSKDDGTLTLDGTALQNLEILANSTDGSTKGSLLALLNRCITTFGKRLFRSWVLKPLYQVLAIEDRLDAVDDLLNIQGLSEDLTKRLSQLPDMERLVARVHAHSCRLNDFVNLLQSIEAVQALTYEVFTDEMRAECKSLQLQGMQFPDLNQELEEMHSYFDWEDAKATGRILPQKGLSPEYDQVLESIEQIKRELTDHLKEQRIAFKCPVTYRDVGKERYQLEVAKGKKAPAGYELMSQTKAVDRYYNSFIKKRLGPLAEAEDTAAVLLKDVLLLLQQKFDAHHQKWVKTVSCIAHIDCLLSLAKASSESSPMCRPVFVSGGDSPVLDIKNGRHPCIIPQLGGDVIPNDLTLGTEQNPPVMVLTGPNMGGKSTLLRQACLTTIMAQIGCYVPAEACSLTPVDRVFTRLGARDDIVSGQSTFMVELQETSNMLRYASKHSLVILDELGRGTSTFDGYAIAYAVLTHLATQIKCRTIFSTHYHTLTEEVGHIPGVGMGYMASVVDDIKREVTFLYRLTPGACPRSYGLHVANMAGVPKEVIDEAEGVADLLHVSLINRLAGRICEAAEKGDVNALMMLWRAAKGRTGAWGSLAST